MYSLTLFSIQLYIFLCIGFQHADCADGENTDEGKLRYCKLDIDPLMKGAKGEQGDNGYVGLEGAKGERGLKGRSGVQGVQGPKGEKGDMVIGIVGPPGKPGVPGKYKLSENDADLSCDYSSPVDKKSYVKVYHTHEKEFQVYCGPNPREICIPKQPDGEMYSYKNKVKPFWISGVGIDLKKSYGLTNVQLDSLKANSTYVRQTLRYHCINSIPYSVHDITKSIRLLTWNDKVVGPYPSDLTPLFYSVPTEYDGCSKESSGRRKHTDIVIQSAEVKRLPIIDVEINDIRNEKQSFYIEHLELCFAMSNLENIRN